MAEIRGQLDLQLDIFKTLYDVEAMAEFQKEVLSAIEEVYQMYGTKLSDVSRKDSALRGTLTVD